MKYIILDLEATCWEKKDKQPNEITEIGALCIDENQNTLGEFNSFSKPIVHPELSEFCTKLTSITQKDVDTAPEFPEVLKNFQDWIESFNDDYFLCSWGFYDRVQFKNDCVLHKLDINWLENHISLKHQYGKIKHKRPIGMKKALKKENIQLEGTHHRGIDDARNIAKIFVKYFEDWDFEPPKKKKSKPI
jgi:inhibitor of KinA sporulation pathway (predicted exonuclease)